MNFTKHVAASRFLLLVGFAFSGFLLVIHVD